MNNNYIILLLILIITCYLHFKIEPFVSKPWSIINFLNKNETWKNAFENNNNFWFKYKEKEAIIRTSNQIKESNKNIGLVSQLKRIYATNLMNYSQNEKVYMIDLITEANKYFGKFFWNDLSKTLDIQWNLGKISGNMDWGFPYTMNNIIIFSQKWLNNIYKKDEQKSYAIETLIHEMTHIWQRLYPKAFEWFYKQQWGFIKANKVNIPPEIEEFMIHNPDGLDMTWIYPDTNNGDKPNTGWLFFFSLDKNDITKQKSLALKVEPISSQNPYEYQAKRNSGGDLEIVSLSKFSHIFHHAGQLYHPNEIFACLFSKVVIQSNTGNGIDYKLWEFTRDARSLIIGILAKKYKDN